MEFTNILEYLLPKEILTYFDLVKIEESIDNRLYLYLDEKNNRPLLHKDKDLISKGFEKEVLIQDFPLREKAVYLKVRRRKWLDKKTKKVYTNKWDFTANGTSYTKEFAAFLKELLG